MDSENRFLGIVYSFEETAPFLPADIAARCIQYHKKERYYIFPFNLTFIKTAWVLVISSPL